MLVRALARAGGDSDLADAMRRIGTPVEASADVAPSDAAKKFSMHAFGAVFMEVAGDADLARARVRRIVGAYAAGRIINPKLARSQCTGAMIGGIGMALMENAVVDARNDGFQTPPSPNTRCPFTLTHLRRWR